jgi:TatD DNase family protein
MFLHDRNTGGDFARIITENRGRFKEGIVHSFTGTQEELKTYIELGLYISLNGW